MAEEPLRVSYARKYVCMYVCMFTDSACNFMSFEWNKRTLKKTPKDELTTTFGVNYVRDVQQCQNSVMYTQM